MARRRRDGKTYSLNGKRMTLAEFQRAVRKPIGGEGVPMISTAYSKPLQSLGAGCHPKQVTEFNQMLAGAGITGARHLPDGKCEFDSREARNQVLKLRNLRDNDAGYGDYAGQNG